MLKSCFWAARPPSRLPPLFRPLQPPARRRTAAAAVSNNILLQDWTGPYDGVPPWDKVKPELFPEAFQVGIDELLAEIDAIANNPAYPSFENTIEAMDKAGKTARPGAGGVRGDDRQYVDARISGARQGMVAQAVGRL